MDDFFRELRRIQKKERDERGLARVGDDFYKKTHEYMEKLMGTLSKDPLNSKGHHLLREVQRITMEICERREHKITDIAVMNVQRSYNLFNKNPKLDLNDKSPPNLTPEEKKLYSSITSLLIEHRSRVFPILQSKPANTKASNKKEKIKSARTEIETIIVYDEVPSTIVGVDEKVYGPFKPQDIVRLPSITARIFVDSGKGRFIKH
ncbi:MAG TPA: hypothetical protein GXX31_04020 [Methanothermobacter sp.]|uniref:Gins51 C-terminal domain-containing protein n=1 Tax=Methanothermobacter tenebrarum TaxID=680118 RepID=A0ABN6PBD6_9EURY|nr:hypothetical protein [Methanothermobacter tenebrarum]MDD3454190.1 hypothetical protein [Methanobacteriales archaeon]MDX9693212.1 hypothetical protein [Methanothermobacter sp.]BDH78754.1 hypothetical protein MTTB_01330 [Methanothermobacter tenebrarum]HHW16529.1 hypothetical protein [Methanothermobacter sp.]HOQ20468.1 hypothetical protein [Methanothermobacter sp.]